MRSVLENTFVYPDLRDGLASLGFREGWLLIEEKSVELRLSQNKLTELCLKRN